MERIHHRHRVGQLLGGCGLEPGEPVHRDHLDPVAPVRGPPGQPPLECLLGAALDHVQQSGRSGAGPHRGQVDDHFPNCIDFLEGDTENGQWNPDPDEGEGWAYAVEDETPEAAYPMHCEDEDMDPIPRLKIGYRWPLSTSIGITTYLVNPNTWDLTSLKVASDMSNMQNDGVSAHADFMSGWSEDQLQELMETCFWDEDHGGEPGSPRNCGFIGEDDEYYDDWPPAGAVTTGCAAQAGSRNRWLQSPQSARAR